MKDEEKVNTEVPGVTGKTDILWKTADLGETEKPAAATAPIVHNAEERPKKNVEGVKENPKYEPVFDLIRKYEEERQKLADNRSESQKKKDARREKMAKIFAALGDGVAAMSNLVLASKGAIPYQSKSMLTKAVGDRYAQFRKDLEDRKAKYLAMSERINELRTGVQRMKDEEERKKAEQALAQAKLAYDKYKDTRDFNYKKGKDDRDYGLEVSKFDYNKTKDAADRKINQQKANADTTNARANASRAATFARNGGGGTRYEFDGKTYGNGHAWAAAIQQKATSLNIPLKEDYEVTDALGYTRKYKKDRKISQILAEVNRAMAAQGGSGGNKEGKGKGY